MLSFQDKQGNWKSFEMTACSRSEIHLLLNAWDTGKQLLQAMLLCRYEHLKGKGKLANSMNNIAINFAIEIHLLLE